jgi:hypothetical protein
MAHCDSSTHMAIYRNHRTAFESLWTLMWRLSSPSLYDGRDMCPFTRTQGSNIQSNTWCHHGSPCPQKLWQEEGQLQVMLRVACDYKGILLTHAVTTWHNTQHFLLQKFLGTPFHHILHCDHIFCSLDLLWYTEMFNCHTANTVEVLEHPP